MCVGWGEFGLETFFPSSSSFSLSQYTESKLFSFLENISHELYMFRFPDRYGDSVRNDRIVPRLVVSYGAADEGAGNRVILAGGREHQRGKGNRGGLLVTITGRYSSFRTTEKFPPPFMLKKFLRSFSLAVCRVDRTAGLRVTR